MSGELIKMSDADVFGALSRALGEISEAAEPQLGEVDPQDVLAPDQVRADLALNDLANTYHNLQVLFGKIRVAYKGNVIPCPVRQKYMDAVNAYLSAGQQIFDQLSSRGYTPQQQLLDSNGNATKTVTISTPVRPGDFTMSDCGTLSGYLGRAGSRTNFGQLPQIIAIAEIVGPYAIRIIMFLGTVAIAAQALQNVFIKKPNADAVKMTAASEAWINAYLKCTETGQTSATCKGIATTAAPPPQLGMSTMEWIGIGALLLGVGVTVGILVFKRYGGPGEHHEPATAGYED
jgi:hypothetical protein